MKKKDEGFKKLYKALKHYEKNNETFIFADLAKMTGYKEQSLSTYNRKKLRGKFIKQLNGKRWKVISLEGWTESQFVRHMSQVSDGVAISSGDKLIKTIQKRALDAFVVAIEIYNRPSLENRVEVFTILMVNAWELLLKAKLASEKGHDAIYYKKESDKSLSLRDVLKRVLKDNDPIRKNISVIEELRDGAIHLMIKEIQSTVSRVFQASVLNFVDCYEKWVGKRPLEGQSAGLLSLILDGPGVEHVVIKDTYGTETAKKVSSFLGRIKITEKELASDKFAISIDYKLALTKGDGNSDLILSHGSTGETAVILEVAKDSSVTHPLKTKDVISDLNGKLEEKGISDIKINQNDFLAIVEKHKIKMKPEYHHFLQQSKMHVYAKELVDWIVVKIKNDDRWLEKAKEYLREKRKKQREDKAKYKKMI